jgi:hypothetical protein
MKKKIFASLIVIAIAAVAAFNVNLSLNQENDMSVLALANIEALAQNESGGTVYCEKACFSAMGFYCLLETSTAYIYCNDYFPRPEY